MVSRKGGHLGAQLVGEASVEEEVRHHHHAIGTQATDQIEGLGQQRGRDADEAGQDRAKTAPLAEQARQLAEFAVGVGITGAAADDHGEGVAWGSAASWVRSAECGHRTVVGDVEHQWVHPQLARGEKRGLREGRAGPRQRHRNVVLGVPDQEQEKRDDDHAIVRGGEGGQGRLEAGIRKLDVGVRDRDRVHGR